MCMHTKRTTTVYSNTGGSERDDYYTRGRRGVGEMSVPHGLAVKAGVGGH